MNRLCLLLIIILFTFFTQNLTADEEYIFTDNDGITVVGTVPTSQQIVTVEKEQIENSGAGDLVNLLQDTLGLNIVRYGGYGNQSGITLRGFDSKRIAILIDGVPVSSSLDGKFDINKLDLNSIERIEIVYGGSDSKFNVSGAFGGIVNIVTVKRQNQGLKLSSSVSNTSAMPGEYRDRSDVMQNGHWEDLFDTQNVSLSAVYGGEVFSLTTNLFFNRAENHFIFLDQANKLRRKDNNEVWDTGASASLVWQLPDLSKLISSSNFYYGDKNFPTSGFSSNTGSQKDISFYQNFMIDSPRAFHDNLSSETSLSWQYNQLDYVSPAGASSNHDQHSISAINRWNWFLGEKFTFRAGLDYRFTGLDSTEIGNRNRHDGGIYLTTEYKPVKSLMLIPSAKVIFTSSGSANTAIIPKLGLLWNVSDNFTIKNNYFRNFKFPDFEELYWSGAGGFGNPDLRPEDGWGTDLGATWRITKLISLESVFFAQWIKDSIHWFSKNAGIWRPENVGEAAVFGFDTKLSMEFPVSIAFIKKISASVSYQYLLSYLLSYGYTFNSNKRIPYNPEHTINGSLEFSWDSGSFALSAHFESLRYHDTANLTMLEPVFLLNANVNQKIGKNITMFGTLRNILNTSYESFYDYPMPGFTITLGMRATLEI